MAKTRKTSTKKSTPKPKVVEKKVVETITHKCIECGKEFEKKGKCPRCFSAMTREVIERS